MDESGELCVIRARFSPDVVADATLGPQRTVDALACLRAHGSSILDHAQSLRPGRTCTVPTLMDEKGFKCGSQSIHYVVQWDDGVEWMLRIKMDAERSTQAARRMMIESEVATMRFMHKHGLPVPNAWACPPLTLPGRWGKPGTWATR